MHGTGGGDGQAFSLELVRELEAARDAGTGEGAQLGAVLAASKRQWTLAQSLLERARRLGVPADIVASDRAAIALAAAATGADPLGRVAALTASDDAVRADPKSAEAWRNRAVVLQQLRLTSLARQAWRRAAELAKSAAARTEGRQRAGQLTLAALAWSACSQQPASWSAWLQHPGTGEAPALDAATMDPQAARLFLEDALLPAWGRARLAGDAARAAVLAAAAIELAGAVSAAQADDLPRHIAAHALAADARGARAAIAYGQGRALFRQLRYEDCVPAMTEARDLLGAIGSPGTLRARAYRAVCLARSGRSAEAEKELIELRAAPYAGIRAHAAEQLGTLHAGRGEPAAARQLFGQAVALFAEADERISLTVNQLAVADTRLSLGDVEGAWQTVEGALRTADRSCSPYARGSALWLAGDLLLRARAWKAAAAFQQESLALERAGGNPTLIVASLRTMTLNQLRLRRPTEALATMHEARRWVGKVPSASVQRLQMGFLDWLEGTALGDHNPAAAIPLLTRSLSVLDEGGRPYERTSARLARGRHLLAVGRRREGRADLLRGIDEYERLRADVAKVTDPARAFADAEGAFDALTESLLDEGGVAEALTAAERGRRPTAPFSAVAAAPARIQARAAVLYLDQMDDRLVVWWMGEQRLRHWQLPWTRAEMRQRVDDLVAARGERDGATARRFADSLLSPAAEDLRVIGRVIVIAEDALAVVPWSGLPHPQGGLWVDHLTITVAPSLGVALHSSRPAQRPDVLVVAQATSGTSGRLRALPAAGEEARALARLYPGASILIGDRATHDAVLARWHSADVLHFAVHAMVDDAVPGAARLVLSHRNDGGGDLTLADVAATRFDRHPLVVLSACSARAGALVPLAGPLDLVRQFLTAGASGVIATLRPVDDALAAQLMIAFHREYARDGDAPAALARATRSVRARQPAATDWAAFQYVGADPSAWQALPATVATSIHEGRDR